MATLFVENSISIKATADKVWDALVNPEQTKKYMFGCAALSDWKVGSPLVWSAEMEGKTIVFVKGFITSIEPCKKLVYTVTDPNASWEDIPENYLNVTYTLSPVNGETILTVRQDGFETAAEGEKRYREVSNNGEGWTPILVQIKKLLEAE